MNSIGTSREEMTCRKFDSNVAAEGAVDGFEWVNHQMVGRFVNALHVGYGKDRSLERFALGHVQYFLRDCSRPQAAMLCAYVAEWQRRDQQLHARLDTVQRRDKANIAAASRQVYSFTGACTSMASHLCRQPDRALLNHCKTAISRSFLAASLLFVCQLSRACVRVEPS